MSTTYVVTILCAMDDVIIGAFGSLAAAEGAMKCAMAAPEDMLLANSDLLLDDSINPMGVAIYECKGFDIRRVAHECLSRRAIAAPTSVNSRD